MGIKLFSTDSRDYGSFKKFSSDNRESEFKSPGVPYYEGKTVVRSNSTPDPTNFTIVDQHIVNGYPILMVKYPDVTNYEGLKILMYGKNFDLNLIKDRIDPHFFTMGDSPIARFEPTAYGMKLAQTLANSLE